MQCYFQCVIFYLFSPILCSIARYDRKLRQFLSQSGPSVLYPDPLVSILIFQNDCIHSSLHKVISSLATHPPSKLLSSSSSITLISLNRLSKKFAYYQSKKAATTTFSVVTAYSYSNPCSYPCILSFLSYLFYLMLLPYYLIFVQFSN